MHQDYRGFLATSFIILAAAIRLTAQTPTYIYYVPFPEQQIHTAFTTLYSGIGTTYRTVVSIVPSESNMVIYYDQWEDGYEANLGLPVQSSTLVFGDKNTGNGSPPGYSSDSLIAGKPIILENDLTLPRNPSSLRYDGRDKFGSTRSLAATRSSWALSPGTVLADAIEFYNTRAYGTFFYFPIGQNTASDNSFSLVSLMVQARENATQVLIDKDGNGTVDVTAVINQGESYQVNGGNMAGGTVTSNKPVQVGLLTGKIGGTYASRWYNLLPYQLWDRAYYTPVGTTNPNARSDVFIFNPQASALTVTYQTLTGSGTFSVPSKGNYRFFMPTNSAGHFHASLPFYAVGAMDMDAANNLTWDWGYTLIPELYLTNSIYVGWGPGSFGSPIPYQGNPVWVASTQDAGNLTIFVDLDGDPTTGPLTDANGNKYNYTLSIPPFGLVTINDPDKDQTGMHVYTIDGSNIVAAWGEDAAIAGPGNPYLDVGTTIPPDPDIVIKKAYKFIYDPLGNNLADPGDTLMFIIRLNNYTLQPITDVFVYDTLPPQVAYKTNTTLYNLLAVADNPAPYSPFPLDSAGFNINLLPAGVKDSITYKVVVNSPLTVSSIPNRVRATESFGNVFRSSVTVPANFASTVCTIQFTNSGGIEVTSYNENETIYIRVTDNDNNFNTAGLDSVKVVLTSSPGDSEVLYLLETGNNTGLFTRSIPSSKITGTGNNNGILYAPAGSTLGVNYTDLVFGGTCAITGFPITGPSFRKPLYLSDTTAGQYLDRTRPWDGTAATSTVLSTGPESILPVQSLPLTAVTSSNTTTLTILNHNPGTGTNRLLLVGIVVGQTGQTSPDPPTVTNVTFKGTTMNPAVGTRQSPGGSNSNDNDVRIYIFSLTNPSSGAGNIDISLSGSGSIAAQAVTFTGVNQITPLGSFQSNAGTSINTSTTFSVTSAANELVYSIFGRDENGNAITLGTGQTAAFSSVNLNHLGGIACTKPGASPTVNVTYTTTTNQDWALGAVSIKPAPGITTTTFTQIPSMCSNLTLPAGGQVKVKLWLTDITGTMPSNPSISAVIKNNGTTFLTLASPVFYNQTGTSDDTLVFTGTLASTQTINAGSPVSIDITNAQSGAAFRISYDATTAESMLRLPVSNVIDITSLGVYDAAYNGGSLITSAYNGSTVYVRTVVTDPFGSYDINGVALRITDPSLVNTDVTMTQVAASDCTKTYEYTWPTGVLQGNYILRAIASEGKENEVKDTTLINFTLQFLDTGTPCSVDFTDISGNPVPSYAQNATLYFKVQDLDQNTNPSVAESVTIVVSSSSGDQETRILTETGVNTGIFTGSLVSSTTTGTGNNNGTLNAPAGALLAFAYTDPDTPSDICNDNAFIVAGTNTVSVLKERILPADFYAVVGDTVRWRIIISNPGSNPTTGLQLVDTVSASCLSYVNATPAPSSNVVTTVRTLTWNTAALGGELNPGQSRTIIITFLAAQGCGTRVNRATLSATNGGGLSVTDTSQVGLDNPQLTIVKTRTSPLTGYVYVGDNVTFSITVTNTGTTTAGRSSPPPAIPLPLADAYSDYNFQFVSATPTESSAGGGQIQWNDIGPVLPGNSVPISVTFKALNGNQGSYVINNASIDFAYDDHNNPIPSVNDSARLIIYSPPLALDDFDTTLVNTVVNGTVMFNDSDDDGEVLTVTPYSGPTTNGNLVLNSNGTYTYTPNPGYTGNDTFIYTLCDPTGKCDTATVTITILPCEDPPVRPQNVH